MANLMALNTVYNYYMTTYAPKGTSPFDTHKKSELRSIYNSMVKLNKDAPLAILDTSQETKEFAVNLKEDSRELKNVIASLGGLDQKTLLSNRIATTDNESVAVAKYIGSNDSDAPLPSLELEVDNLAEPQVNTGDVLSSDETTPLEPGSYSFDIAINNLNYEFQFRIHDSDTNKDVQERLGRLITNSGIGINADVISDDEGNSVLKLTSLTTGIPQTAEAADQAVPIFTVSDEKTSKNKGAVDYLGIGDTSRYPKDAHFKINGAAKSASSNNFTIEKTYEIQLNGVSEPGIPTKIGLKTDTESLSENINSLIQGYNSFMTAAGSYVEEQPKAKQLINEMKSITSVYSMGLENAGLSMKEDGTIEVDNKQLVESLDDDSESTFQSLKDFTGGLLRKTSQVSLDPMNYVKKTIVAYKNPGKSLCNPYVSSSYSGMMFNSYC